jgi:hypothetical protein
MPKLTLLPLSFLTSLLTAVLAGDAVAGPAYRWTAADGSIAFSDELKRIPSQYRASAVRVGTRSLDSYPRYTPAETGAARNDRTEALVERIQRLREINGTAGGAVASRESGQPTQTILRLDDRAAITFPNGRVDNDEPIVVEERRVRDRNNISTTHVTVVRRGEEILSVVRPESAHDRGDWQSERELLGEE